MASWRERYAWWREFHYLGAADVKRRMEHVIWAQEKRREAEHFLWWHANWLKVLGMVIPTLGVVVAALGVLVSLLSYLATAVG
jgi:flagellar motor component MotA